MAQSKRSAFQILLSTISVVLIIIGILVVLMGCAFLVYGGSPSTIEAGAGGAPAGLGPLSLATGILIIIEGAASIVLGLLGRGASTDAYRIGPFRIFSFIGLALSVAACILAIINLDPASIAASVFVIILMVVSVRLANNIWRQVKAGEL